MKFKLLATAACMTTAMLVGGHAAAQEKLTVWWGKGFYKMLLIATLNLTGFESLSSNDRNSYSNPAYKKWCNNENLSQSTEVIISVQNEDLIFTY